MVINKYYFYFLIKNYEIGKKKSNLIYDIINCNIYNNKLNSIVVI